MHAIVFICTLYIPGNRLTTSIRDEIIQTLTLSIALPDLICNIMTQSLTVTNILLHALWYSKLRNIRVSTVHNGIIFLLPHQQHSIKI